MTWEIGSRRVILISDADIDITAALVTALSVGCERLIVAASASFCIQDGLAIVRREPLPFAPAERVEQALDALFDDLDDAQAVILALGAQDEKATALAEYGLVVWEQRFESALRRIFLVARHAVQAFLAAGAGGSLVFVAPRGCARADAAGWALSEGLRSFARSLAKEYGRRQIRTNIVEGHGSQETAEMVAWLVSSRAGFVNGDILRARSDSL